MVVHVISEANYDIINSGKDDTGTTNSVFVSGRKSKYTHSQTVAFSNLQYTWSDATDLLILQNGHYVTPVVERIISVMRTDDTGSGSTEILVVLYIGLQHSIKNILHRLLKMGYIIEIYMFHNLQLG